MLTLKDRRVERGGLDTLVDPVDENSEACLRERSVRLRGVGSTVSCSGNEEQAVPVIERGAFVEGHVWVHDLADRLVIAHGRSCGNAVVGLAVEGKDLAARVVEGRQVRPGRMQSVLVGLPAFDYPTFKRVVGDTVEVGKVELLGSWR